MSISANNDRLTVIIPKSVKEELKQLADLENRSLSNYVVNILENHVTQNKRGLQRNTQSNTTSQNDNLTRLVFRDDYKPLNKDDE
jgi:hypothetical protein